MSDTDLVNEDDVRQCYICLGTDGSEWVQPCRCTGSLAWVHKKCILRWIRGQPIENLVCPQCLTPFHVTPPSSMLLVMEYIAGTVYPCIKDASLALASVVAVDVGCISLGMFPFFQVYGVGETIINLLTACTAEHVVKLHVISYSLLTISAIPWEDYVLRSLQSLGKLPVLSLFLPAYTSPRTYAALRKPSFSRIISRSVMLPIYGRVCGEVFFRNVDDMMTRIILGGMSFLVVKGGVYMYFSQKLMVRLDQITVLNHPSEPRLTVEEGTQTLITISEEEEEDSENTSTIESNASKEIEASSDENTQLNVQ